MQPKRPVVVIVGAGFGGLATAKTLANEAVDIVLIDQHNHHLCEQRIPAATVIWAAGVKSSPAAKWLDAKADRAGRVIVEADFSVPGLPEIFVIGDTASLSDSTGRIVPGVAPAAKQAGRYAGLTILARLFGKPAPAPFRYRNYGNMTTIGRHAGVADFGWIRLITGNRLDIQK